MRSLDPHFREFVELLEENKVDYLIVGGYAVAFYGFARYTGDIDFFVAVNSQNAEALVKVFKDFGFESLKLTKEDFLQEGFVIEIGREPTKIQILTGIDGIKFYECRERCVTVEVDGLSLKFIDKESLLRNKLASGRPKDLLDISVLTDLGKQVMRAESREE